MAAVAPNRRRVRVMGAEVCTSLLYMPHELFPKLPCVIELAAQDVHLRVHLDRRRRRLELPQPGELAHRRKKTAVSALLPAQVVAQEALGYALLIWCVLRELGGHQPVEELDKQPA